MTHGRGWIQPIRVVPEAPRVVVGAVRRPESVELGRPIVKDQKHTQACTGFAIMQAEHLYLEARGIAHELASPFFPYWFARREGVLHDRDVADVGTDPFLLVDAAADFGACDYDTWSPDSVDVDARPADVAIISAQQRRMTLAPMYSRGSALAERVLDALAMNLPVILALDVDVVFERNDGPTVIGPRYAESIGKHAVCAYGFDGSGVFIANSWGTGWRNAGCAVLSLEALGHAIWAGAVTVNQ